MSGQLIAVANMKGGVGKTTTVIMLAEALAAGGASVLVVDLDPQGSASVSLSGEALLSTMIRSGRTLDAFLALRVIRREEAVLAARIRTRASPTVISDERLDVSLLPSGPFLRVVEREIVYELTKRHYTMNAIEGELWRLFRDEFAPLAERYDYIVFDCAPGISPMTEIAVRASDLVLVACIPDFLSTFGLAAFFQTFWGRVTGSTLRAPRRRPVVLPTRVQRAVKQHRLTLDRLRTESQASGAFRLLDTVVPQAARLGAALSPTTAPIGFAAKYGPLADTVLSPLVAELKACLADEPGH